MWDEAGAVPGDLTDVGQSRQGCQSTDRVGRKHAWGGIC